MLRFHVTLYVEESSVAALAHASIGPPLGLQQFLLGFLGPLALGDNLIRYAGRVLLKTVPFPPRVLNFYFGCPAPEASLVPVGAVPKTTLSLVRVVNNLGDRVPDGARATLLHNVALPVEQNRLSHLPLHSASQPRPAAI